MFEPDVVYDSRRVILPEEHTRPTTERPWVRWTLIGIAVLFMALVLVLPLVLVFTEAFRKGADTYFAAFSDRQSQQAILLTLLNVVFVYFGVRFYRERRLDIYALGDRGRALLYGGIAGIVLALAGTRRWLDTGAGTAASCLCRRSSAASTDAVMATTLCLRARSNASLYQSTGRWCTP